MVKLAAKLTFGQATADWQEGINPERLRRCRQERARGIMRKHGVAAMLEAIGPHIRYLTGVRGFDYQACRYVLFFAEHDPVLFEHSTFIDQGPEQAPWITEWRTARSWLTGAPGMAASQDEAQRFGADIHAELEKRGLVSELLALGGFDGIARDALAAAGIKNIVASQPIMLEARAIKNQDEINCLKMVAAIADGVWYRIWERLRPGMRDTELPGIASEAAYEFGAEFAVPGAWRTGPASFDRGYSNTSRILQVGDLVYGSVCGILYMGYGSCTYRTFIVGRQPNAREKSWYAKMRDRVDAVIDAIKPGKTTADAAQHFLPASTWGYTDESQVLASEIGHGTGIGSNNSYDMPIINRLWSLKHPQVFEEGMTMAVECREGESKVGGVRLENMILITRDGAEIIDHFPREEILVAPR